jgi:hypothetical protein
MTGLSEENGKGFETVNELFSRLYAGKGLSGL